MSLDFPPDDQRPNGASDVAVVGGGLVGSAIAFGLARAGASVALIDAGEDSFHASAGNFGLIWVQGKGAGKPEYAALSRRSADLWHGFAQTLSAETGIDPAHEQTGGIKIALSEEELAKFEIGVGRMHDQAPPGGNDTRMVDAKEIRDLVPGLGPRVVGGAYCPHDGFADPLSTLKALRTAIARAGNASVTVAPVEEIVPLNGNGFMVRTRSGEIRAGQVVLAAGHGSVPLAAGLGLQLPIRPERGQILVSERLPAFLHLACHTVRQTREGTVLMGDSKENVGFDTGTTQSAAREIANRAVTTFPALAKARIVRQWGALRILSPDGFPIYQEMETHPGAFIVTCHSGVTLAAVHALEVARAILDGDLKQKFAAFSLRRFDEAGA